MAGGPVASLRYFRLFPNSKSLPLAPTRWTFGIRSRVATLITAIEEEFGIQFDVEFAETSPRIALSSTAWPRFLPPVNLGYSIAVI